MRQLVLDTETTGLEVGLGHRIIEIGCVELVNRRLTGRNFHKYINPDREIDDGALEVHGITQEFLSDKPCFADIWDEFKEFLQGDELIIHNAPFDVAFLNHEIGLLNLDLPFIQDQSSVVDSLALAREKHPGQRNSLDALCRRYSIDNSQRVLHGALLDAEILSDVYLLLTGGQGGLFDVAEETKSEDHVNKVINVSVTDSQSLSGFLEVRASESEVREHEEFLSFIEERNSNASIWRSSSEPD
tara:strand:+ start:21 stop:752 length:732 start_codon:yes stop_codon:yes gene_type:complete